MSNTPHSSAPSSPAADQAATASSGPAQPDLHPDADAQANAAAPAGRSLEELLAEAQTKFEQQREAWLRAVADAENARKRAQQDIAAAHKYAVERFVDNLLPVVDALEATLGNAGAGLDTLRSGVELTLRQMRSALEKANVSDIDPAAGEKFDPHRHQAMAALESDSEPNTVITVMQKGWRLHERIIRPALVTVAKRKAQDAGGEPGSEDREDRNG